ncbi:M20 family metallopeptidase [Psychromarinibacter sp. S121]|uniref:M20 family metallopeptidase n=1 Tax=Psychromarinibacter sp. S121 TaxID=3415127 RepID=UPI003C7CCC79
MPHDSKTLTAQPVTRDEAVSLLSEMVRIPSINPNFLREGQPEAWHSEAALAQYILEWCTDLGLPARLDEVLPGRPNVVVELITDPDAPSILWEGHTDTVQVEGMAAPFEPRLEGDLLYGRGSVDDKGCLAMFMLAMAALKRAGTPCNVTFVAAVDEESTFLGVLHHVATHPPAEMGVAGEPTELAMVTACKGVIRFVVEVTGRGAHASQPHEGLDALAASAQLVLHLREYIKGTPRTHSTLGPRSLTCTMMEAGEGQNTVPARARLTFDMRTLPDQSGEDAWNEISGVVAAFAADALPEFGVTMHPPFIDSISQQVPDDARIVAEMGAVLAARGLPAAPIAVPYGSDASKMTKANTPTIVFGPGTIDVAHSDNEHVDVTEVVRAAEILVELVQHAGGRRS